MLKDFKLNRLTIEGRYANAYLLWDKAGQLSNRLTEIFPMAELQSATPGEVKFKAGRRWSISVALGTCRAIDFDPPASFDADPASFVRFYSAVTDILEIRRFTRVGVRLDYALQLGSDKAVREYILDKQLIKTPKKKTFDVEPKTVKTQFLMSVEDEDLGYAFGLNGVARKVDVEPPPELNLPPQSHESYIVELLIDLYNVKEIEVTQLRLDDLLRRCRSIVHRDTDKLLSS